MRRLRRDVKLTAAMILASSLWGCATQSVSIDSAAGLYDSAELTYTVDAGRLGVPLAVSRIEGQLISYDQVPSSPLPAASLGTLTVQYPHPRQRPGFALAEMSIARTEQTWVKPSRPSAEPSRWHKLATAPIRLFGGSADDEGVIERWQFDITKVELDRIIARLNQTGFFERPYHAGPGVEVAAELDGASIAKNWHAVPELDALMLKVRGHGQLVWYARPEDTLHRRGDAGSSLLAYRAFLSGTDASDRTELASSAVGVPLHTGVSAPPLSPQSNVARLPSPDGFDRPAWPSPSVLR